MINFLVRRRFPDEPRPSTIDQAAIRDARPVQSPDKTALSTAQSNASKTSDMPLELSLPRALIEDRQRAAETTTQAVAYRDKLYALSRSDLDALFDSEFNIAIEEQRALRENAIQSRNGDADRAERELFIYHPSASADFEHYARLATWTLDEVLGLLLGKNPELLASEQIINRLNGSKFQYDLERLRTIVNRAYDANQLQDNNYPEDAISWARSIRLPIPKEFDEYFPETAIDWKSKAETEAVRAEMLQTEINRLTDEQKQDRALLAKRENKSALTKELRMSEKLLFGVCNAKYGITFDGIAKPSLRKILDDLAEIKLKTDDQTLRGHLRSGSEEVARRQ